MNTMNQLKRKDAYSYFVKYHELKDSVYNTESRKKLFDLQIRSETEQRENEIALLAREKQLKVLEIKQREDEIYRQQILKYWIIVAAFLIILLFLFIHVYSVSKAAKNKHLLEQNLNLYMQKALSQQMNPHFIFNTLNSIQFFLLNNDKISSNKYLTKFARLMRITLDNSQSETISLYREIESLNLYIELEQLRFENKFTFKITTGADIDTELISIPPLIIQPFVENAIWHGIMHRDSNEDGKLIILFSISENNLICTIEDNGIGREKANEIRKQKKPEHISLGTQITESRISLINQLYNKKLNITYHDLFAPDGTASGTRVEICFPI